MNGIILALLLAFGCAQYPQQLYPTTTCPQLCLTYCNPGNTCLSCYTSFLANSTINQTCACPPSFYLDSNAFCKPCPIYCQTCSKYSVCTSCITGYMIKNNYSCTINTTNYNGWVSKNVSYELAGQDYVGVSNLVVIVNNTAINITNSPQSLGIMSSNYSKLSGYSWLGGHQIFNFRTKIIKTIFNLPPHQWLNVMFQAILIDYWYNNTLLVQLNGQQNYNPNSVQSPYVIWSGSFDCRLRTYDFCGNASVSDNLAIVNAWVAHNASSLKLQIRLNQSDSNYDPYNTLNFLWFGIRQLFIRVGTCGRNCQYCQSPSICTQCFTPYVAVNGSCICDSSFGIGFPTLTGCSPLCSADQYYNQTAKGCLNCEDEYDNCHTCNMTQCLTCNPGFLYYKDNLGNIQCLRFCPNNFTLYIGYSAVQNQTINNSIQSVTIIRDQCVPCPSNCLTCNKTVCFLCYSTYQFYQGACQTSCPAGTYSLYGECRTCPINCSICNSYSCSNCNPGYKLQNYQCYRVCADSITVLNSSTSTCNANCSSPCVTCFGPSSNQCLSCRSGLVLLAAFSDGSCLSSCPTPFYPKNGVCILCPFGCSSCTGQNTCFNCISGYYLWNGTCGRFCPYATYASAPDQITANLPQNVCLSCPTGCRRCSDSTTCIQCAYNYNFFNFSCLEQDPDQFQPWEGQYRKCSPNCLKCTNKVCTRCQSNYFLNQGLCVPTCPPQKYPKSVFKFDFNSNPYQDNVCAWKNPLCQIYNSTLLDGSCSQCSFTVPALVIIQGWQWQPSFLCSFTCPQYYTKADNLTCIQCPQNCLRCLPNMTCIQCIFGYSINSPNLLNSSNVMNSTCLQNACGYYYFTDSQQCQSCASGCLVCLMDNTCFICDRYFILDPVSHLCVNSNCSQFNQFFNSTTGLCQTCSANCRNCFNQSTFCTSCPLVYASTTSQTYLYGGKCVSSCPIGYFPHMYSLSCRLCNPRCSSCSNFDNCLSCKANFYVLNFYSQQSTICVVQCPIGFWTNITICQRCFPDCKTCYGPSQYQCLSCYPNFYLDDYKCVYTCSPMKYKDNQGHCDWCHSSCQYCTGPSIYDCMNCPQNQYYYDHGCFNKSCPSSTYLSLPNLRICQPCQFGCSFCSSSQFCYFCTPGYKFYQGWCFEKCPGNLVANNITYYGQWLGQICLSCKYAYSQKCLYCDRSCKRCREGYYLYRSGYYKIYESGAWVLEQCYSSCPQATFLRSDGGKECISCSPYCQKCNSYSNCTQCINWAFNLINGYCTANCPASTFQTVAGSCVSCSSQCLSCTNYSTSCTSCVPNYYLYKPYMSCLSSCPAYYYADLSGWCLRCPKTCSACSSANNCTGCQARYILANGLCVNSSSTCNTNCKSCSGGNCLACNSSYLLYTDFSSGTTTCETSCPSNWFAFAGKCYICNVTCATCSNTLNNCSSCSPGLYLYQQSCLLFCPMGYYASPVTQTCQSCPPNCIICNSGNCTQCISGFFLNQGVCNSTCPAATFRSLSSQMCFSCNDNCATCADIQNCTVCATGYLLLNLACVDSCPSTSYQVTSAAGQVCMPCASPCYTCTSPEICLSCISSYILNGTICQQTCGDGYFLQSSQVSYDDQVDDQDYSNFLQCLRCNIECLTCRDYSNNCATCAVGYVLANSRCLTSCSDGTYNQSFICQPCSSYCVKCSNLSTCAACIQGTVLYNGLCLNSCPQGFYMTLNSTAAMVYYYCTGCSPSCQSCNGSTEYSCLFCNPAFFLSNGMCLTACPQGTYATNVTRTCSQCPYTCTNCSSFSKCGGCIVNYTLSNTNQCNPPTYVVCNVSYCVSCSAGNSSSCQQCTSNYYLLSNGTCTIACPSMTYAQAGSCINCPINCTACTANQCTSCRNNFYIYLGSCYSSCPISTIAVKNTCVPDPCLYYNTSFPNSCLACTTPYLLATTNTSTGYQSCVSSCPAATVQTGAQCIACPFNCNSCQSSNACTNCSNITYLNSGLCVYSCPIGTYSINSQCLTCNISFCTQCNGSRNCTKCSIQNNAFLFNGQCYLSCPAGTYNDYNTGLCTVCPIACQKCSTATSCTSCNANYYYYQGSCQNGCPSGTYTSNGSNICMNCSTGCNNCSSASSCNSCNAGFIYYSNQKTCVTSCPSGYYSKLVWSTAYTNSSQYQCLACVAPCLTCTSSSNCISCLTGTFLSLGSCVAACPAGSYSIAASSNSNSQPSCLPCDSTCLACSNTSTYCTACLTGYILDAQGNCNSNCSNPSTYYSTNTRQCLNCSAFCFSCQGPLPTDCLSCSPPLTLYSGSCLTSCPFGYYTSPTYVCRLCSPVCASCAASANNCTSCSNPNLLQPSNTGFICSNNCFASFYPNITSQICQPCDISCFNCTGPASNQCYSCPSAKILSGGSCVSNCSSGTTLISQGSQSICQPCSTGCLNCSTSSYPTQATNCTLCQPNNYLYSGSCFASCPAGTYSTPASYICSDCGLAGCQVCTYNSSMLVQCTVCGIGYFSLGDTGTCVSSCPSGYSLINIQCVAIAMCQQYVYNGTCVASCPTSTYSVVSPVKTCLGCPIGCYSCLNDSICLQCSNPTFLYFNASTNTSTCLTYCPVGYYNDVNTGGCILCGSNCSACYQSNSQIICTACQSGLLLGTQCTQSCPLGYYSSSNVCQLCASICLSCVGTASNCTLCKNINYTAPACSNPNCTATQYMGVDGSCISCDSACATCYGGNSYECISCSNTTYNLNGQCLAACPQGTTPDSLRNCVSCPNNCIACSSVNSSQCSQCLSGYLLVSDSSQCVGDCNSLSTSTQTYYSNGSACLVCSLANCLVCVYSNLTLQCQSCIATAYSYNNSCLSSCPSGTYAMTSSNRCNQCQTNCLTCSSDSVCTSCSADYALVTGSCNNVCGSGFYLSTTNSITTCNPCSAKCLSCMSAVNCTNCAQPYLLVNYFCTGCLSGYYYSSDTSTCLLCSSYCATCSMISSNCTTCASGYSLFNSSICVSSCPIGYYSSNAVCLTCATPNCALCTSAMCTYCLANYLQMYLQTTGQLTCISSCLTGQFLSPATNTCNNCSQQCLTCSSTTSCSQCSYNYLLYLGQCVGSCPSGFASFNYTCVPCQGNCKICASLTNCTVCVSSAYSIVGGVCTTTINCTAGYYPNNLGTCSQCYPNCLTCNGGLASNCLACFNGSTLNNGVCIQSCDSASFFDSSTSSCKSCSSIFSNCVSCTSSSCNTCIINYSVVNGICTFTCPNGTYISNQQCLSCPVNCTVCSSSNNCSQCAASTLLVNGSCSSSCPNSTYQNGNNCSACYQTCLTCTNSSSSSCTSCLPPYNYNLNSCIVSCPNSTYSSDSTCQPCSSNCVLCDSSGCTQCSLIYYLISGTCVSSCPDGYFADTASARCLACVPPCSLCRSRIICNACSPPYNLIGTICVGPCSSGQYYDPSLSSCVSCTMSNCGFCNSTSCDACLSTYYSYYSNAAISACVSTCNNIQGTYNDNIAMNCSSCSSNCQNCVNATYCNLCSPSYYLFGASGVNTNECIQFCPLGYFGTLSKICSTCGRNCNVCQNDTYCDVCSSNYYLLTSPNISSNIASCLSQCPTGYYNSSLADGNGKCIPCAANCLTCVDINSCLQCISSIYVLSSGQCIPSNCLNCQNCDTTNNVCRNCTSPFYINNGGCVSSCPKGQYGSNTTDLCTTCMENCLSCSSATNCTQCSAGRLFVQSTFSCQNQGFVDFGPIGNMSGFTSNITEVMATIYVSTSAGPIAFGALTSTYGPMHVCQFMYFLRGSCGDNPQLQKFLKSLSIVSYTSDSNSQSSSNSSTSSRLLTGIDYTSNFLQTNLPIFLMMVGFVSAYVLVLLLQKYNESCCLNHPNARKYVNYICQFMKKRFKYIYVDCVMWISYMPFLYFSLLQLQKLRFDTPLNAISTIIAFIIIILYPLYPIFILRKIFDKSDNPEEHLRQYSAITLRLPLDLEEEAKKSICEGVTCCPKQNPDVSMIQMSLSPWIDSVVRPVYNQDLVQYRQFRYFTVPHLRLAYAAIKYVRKFLFVLVAALCADPVNTLSILIALNIVYMLYLLILKPKQKIYLILELILQFVILFFLVFMLVYLKLGGATVTAMSVLAHGIGFLLANSTLAIAIILNIMAYYTIICCVIDFVRHLKNSAQADEIKEKQKQQFNQIDPALLNEKDELPANGQYGEYPEDGEHMDLEKELIKKFEEEDLQDKELRVKEKQKKGNDQLTEENDEDYPVDKFQLDEKEFNAENQALNKNRELTVFEANQIPNLNRTYAHERKRKRESNKQPQQNKQFKQIGYGETQIKIKRFKGQTSEQGQALQEGQTKLRENVKPKRKSGNNEANPGIDIIKEATNFFKRNSNHKNSGGPFQPQQQSMDFLFTSPNANRKNSQYEQFEDVDTHTRLRNFIQQQKDTLQIKISSRKIKTKEQKNSQTEQIIFKERQNLSKQQQGKYQQVSNAKERKSSKYIRPDSFGEFQEIQEPKHTKMEEVGLKQIQNKKGEYVRNKQKLVPNFLVQDDDDFNLVQRKPAQPKKPQNKFYKKSDDEDDIAQVQAKERQVIKAKQRNNYPQAQLYPKIEAASKDIITKKAERLQESQQFTENKNQGFIFKQRQRQITGVFSKAANIQQKQPYSLQQARESHIQKRQEQQLGKPSIYDQINSSVAETVFFEHQIKIRQHKSANEIAFQEQNTEKQRRKVEEAMRKQKDARLRIGSNQQQNYYDLAIKNRQQPINRPYIPHRGSLPQSSTFVAQNYAARPELNLGRPRQKSKDLGFSVSNTFDENKQDNSYNTDKKVNKVSLDLKKKGNMQLKQEGQLEEQSGSRDQRRVSKMQSKKLRIKGGVLNIDQHSEDEDIQEYKL